MTPADDQASWLFAIDEDKLQENGTSPVFPKGLPVLLIKKEGRVYAVSNKCAHMACGLTAAVLKDHAIQCPCHDWQFDIRTGEFLNAPEIKIPTYPCRSSEGKIYIKINEGGRS